MLKLRFLFTVAVTLVLTAVVVLIQPARGAAGLNIPVNLTAMNGVGASVGSINVRNTQYGLLLTPNLRGITPGLHGFHVHQNPDCGPAEKNGAIVPGLAAGGHFDPRQSGNHEGPYGEGHLGDLPPLYVGPDGVANVPVLAPRLAVSDVWGRSLMIHARGDNFSDTPSPLGGGGPREACGVMGSRLDGLSRLR
ncbi:MAG: superoxide dismutase [Cu-Zn] SodC [Leptolyngbyaceae cyanobacterium MO_188.B28]|nr:superoxide dismutase [Cu-Zn] SodC [Leptolyngbyaceae cyanobacterium MO_188.B28]